MSALTINQVVFYQISINRKYVNGTKWNQVRDYTNYDKAHAEFKNLVMQEADFRNCVPGKTVIELNNTTFDYCIKVITIVSVKTKK